jgi:vacuolar-type H+-ATPase subunit E/Vma4
MAIDDILTALDEQAESDCAGIIEQAQHQADAILREAREQAEAARAARLQRARAQVEPRVDQMVNSAGLQNKRDLDAARAGTIESVFDDASRRLATLRDDDPQTYARVFKALLEEALAGTDGDAEVVVDPADVTMASSLLTATGTACTVTAATIPQGGVTVLSRGGKVARRNTFEDRLDAVRRTSASDVAGILFG